MFAVVRAGSKQFKVARDEVIVVDRMLGESGSTIDLGDVLIVGDGAKTTVGKPVVDGAKVKATVVEHPGPKRSRFSNASGAKATAARRATASLSRCCVSRKFPSLE